MSEVAEFDLSEPQRVLVIVHVPLFAKHCDVPLSFKLRVLLTHLKHFILNPLGSPHHGDPNYRAEVVERWADSFLGRFLTQNDAQPVFRVSFGVHEKIVLFCILAFLVCGLIILFRGARGFYRRFMRRRVLRARVSQRITELLLRDGHGRLTPEESSLLEECRLKYVLEA